MFTISITLDYKRVILEHNLTKLSKKINIIFYYFLIVLKPLRFTPFNLNWVCDLAIRDLIYYYFIMGFSDFSFFLCRILREYPGVV